MSVLLNPHLWIKIEIVLVVQGKLIHPDVLKEQFVCHLDKCKGACCWEGSYGAPLNKEEVELLEQLNPVVSPYLPERHRALLAAEGGSRYYRGMQQWGTNLMPDGACVYLIRDDNGIAKCGIEHCWKQGEISFRKPQSCHLYPVRVRKDPFTGMEMLLYDRWDICQDACALGAALQVPVYRFVKEALIRVYGEAFYAELDAIAQSYLENEPER